MGLPNVCTKHKIPKNLQKGQEGSIRPCGSENWVWYSKYILIIAPIAPLYGDGSKPCTPSEPQNSWDLWMFIPLKMVSIGIDPYPYRNDRMILFHSVPQTTHLVNSARSSLKSAQWPKLRKTWTLRQFWGDSPGLPKSYGSLNGEKVELDVEKYMEKWYKEHEMLGYHGILYFQTKPNVCVSSGETVKHHRWFWVFQDPTSPSRMPNHL